MKYTTAAIVLVLLLMPLTVFSQDAVRVPEAKSMAFVVSKVQPEYPAMARQMKVAGKVEVDVFLDETGKLDKVETVSGNMLLVASAQRAIRQWKFKAVDVTGAPSKAVLRVSFNFTN